METGPEFKIEVSILKDVATVMIDTTGSSLLNVVNVRKKGGALSQKPQRHFTPLTVSRQAPTDPDQACETFLPVSRRQASLVKMGTRPSTSLLLRNGTRSATLLNTGKFGNLPPRK